MTHTVNDLLKLIGEGSSEPKPIDSSLGGFLERFDIKASSDNKVKNSIIWYTYKKVHNGEMTKIAFFRELSKLFEKTRTGKQRYYKVTGEFDLTREGLIRSEHFNKG